MSGKIESGQLVTVEPVNEPSSLRVGDIVLCKVKGSQYLHMVMKIRGSNEEFEIGGYNRNFTNGWIGANQIYGKCVDIED
jgi:exosome complex RNA-binding protein Csl4